MNNYNVKININDEDNTKLNEKLNEKDLAFKEYIKELIDKDLNSTVKLDKGFSYNKETSRLYNEHGEVDLTKLEKALFKVLIENQGKIVDIETIHNVAWKGKNMTRFTLRCKIKTLRDKTYHELIKNHSNLGYEIAS